MLYGYSFFSSTRKRTIAWQYYIYIEGSSLFYLFSCLEMCMQCLFEHQFLIYSQRDTRETPFASRSLASVKRRRQIRLNERRGLLIGAPEARLDCVCAVPQHPCCCCQPCAVWISVSNNFNVRLSNEKNFKRNSGMFYLFIYSQIFYYQYYIDRSITQ